MEHDLIRRSELLAKKCMVRGHLDTGSPCPSKVKAVPVDVIERAPSVDAEPVRHGRWEPSGSCEHRTNRKRNTDKWTTYKCSECGFSNGRRFRDNFCPNCGAKMDKGEDDA